MLDSTPYGFALELAVAASRREYLDLQQWLSDRFRQLALPFFQVGCRTKHMRYHETSSSSPQMWYEAELTEALATLLITPGAGQLTY